MASSRLRKRTHEDVCSQAWVSCPLHYQPQHLHRDSSRDDKLTPREAAARHAPAQWIAVHERPSQLVEAAR